MTVKLYRAVSAAEFAEAISGQRLGVIDSSLEGKWFAESAVNARRWGLALTRLGGVAQDRILEIEFPDAVANRFFRIPALDGIGPARFATIAELADAVAVREATHE